MGIRLWPFGRADPRSAVMEGPCYLSRIPVDSVVCVEIDDLHMRHHLEGTEREGARRAMLTMKWLNGAEELARSSQRADRARCVYLLTGAVPSLGSIISKHLGGCR